MEKNKIKKNGFTLAEVLITLVIIGVIASLTIPVMMQNKQKQETIAQFKKMYSTINQAIKLAEVENGPCSTWDWGSGTAEELEAVIKTVLIPKLKVQKYCGLEAGQKCFASSYGDIDGKPLGFNFDNYTLGVKVTLSDGSSIFFLPSTEIFIDINGLKGPNKLGYDLYMFALDKTNSRLITDRGNDAWCTRNSSTAGWYHGASCAGKIMYFDSWDITYW